MAAFGTDGKIYMIHHEQKDPEYSNDKIMVKSEESSGFAELVTVSLMVKAEDFSLKSAVVAGDYLCCKTVQDYDYVLYVAKTSILKVNERILLDDTEDFEVIKPADAYCYEDEEDFENEIHPCSMNYALHSVASQFVNKEFLHSMSNHLQFNV